MRIYVLSGNRVSGLHIPEIVLLLNFNSSKKYIKFKKYNPILLSSKYKLNFMGS
jgi:hypothetical protein